MFGGRIGIPEILVLLFMLGVAVGWVAIWGRIAMKAGYSFWNGLWMLVPLGNIGFILFLCFAEWPVLAELEARRAQVNVLSKGTQQ